MMCTIQTDEVYKHTPESDKDTFDFELMANTSGDFVWPSYDRGDRAK
jgi:hypothetical protein